MTLLEKAIEKNRERCKRFDKATKMLSRIRHHWFDYEDAGKGEQAQRMVDRLLKRLEPLHKAREKKFSVKRIAATYFKD